MVNGSFANETKICQYNQKLRQLGGMHAKMVNASGAELAVRCPQVYATHGIFRAGSLGPSEHQKKPQNGPESA